MKMTNTNRIGLDSVEAKLIADKLNILLADYMIFYQNVRGLHWNIKGDKFFELHVKYEELYDDLAAKVDEVAERILTLGATPLHTFEDFTENSSVKSIKNVTDGVEGVKSILTAFKDVLELQREILDISGDAGDEGTNSLMSDYISSQEKLVWMYSAFLK